MRQATTRQRFRYWFDNTMSRGTPALIGWLALLSAVMIVVVALLVALLGVAPAGDDNQPVDLVQLLWMNLLRTLDPGTMGGDRGSPIFLLAMLFVTVGGIFLVSALIGVLTTGLDNRLAALRKGRSFVVEQGHTLILGWSEQIFTVVSELAVANANQKRPCVVILADKDKVEMEDEIQDRLGHGQLGKLRVICRTGKPIDLVDLNIVNPQGSRAIIVLSPNTEEPDAEVIKTVLAITNNPRRRPDPYHIVAPIRDPRNMEAARLVGGDEAQLVDVGDAIARLTAQTSRQSGLSVVYTELLDFGGDEIYFQSEPSLAGKTFGDSIFAYEDSAVLGLQMPDGTVSINPPMDTPITQGTRVIAISEDDDTVKVSRMTAYNIDQSAILTNGVTSQQPDRALILGWNSQACTIINELDNYVVPGSSVTAVSVADEAEGEVTRRCANLHNLDVHLQYGDTTDRSTLDALDVPSFDHVMVLSYGDRLDPQHADARTLITLLHLRDIRNRSNAPFSIVSEMEDINNKELAEVTQADDFILSDTVISYMLSQIAENRYLTAVFTDLFRPEGSEIYLKPAQDYIVPGKAINFYTVVEAARRRGHVAIGYRQMADSKDPEKSYGVVVNPDKSKPITFAPNDRVIVLAES